MARIAVHPVEYLENIDLEHPPDDEPPDPPAQEHKDALEAVGVVPPAEFLQHQHPLRPFLLLQQTAVQSSI